MEAVIVAGGIGSRLRPLTQFLPKHLLPVAGVPFVEHQIAKLASAGIDRVVMATSYQADLFRPELGDGARWGVELVYVCEEQPLGTAGAIRNVAGHLRSRVDEPVVILNGDILSDHDLAAQLTRHREVGAEVTLHLVEVPDARAFGCVPTDPAGWVTAFVEKSEDPVSHQINAGCYVFARRVVDEIPPGVVVSVERQTFPELLRAGRPVAGFVTRGYWLDLGTPRALVRASAELVRGVTTSPAYPRPGAERWVADGARVAPTASLQGGTSVGAAAVIEPGATVSASVVCAGAIIEKDAVVVDSIIGPGARVGARAVLRDAVLGDRSSVGAGCELIGGARVWCDRQIPDRAIRFSSDI